MRPLFILVLVSAAGLLAGCPVGAALPPAKAEVGPVATAGESGGAGLRVSAGTHLASGDPRRERRIDIGGGYVYERTFAGANDSHGGYLELQARIATGRSWRAWAGLRGELLGGERDFGGGAARVSWELTMPVHGTEPLDGPCAFGVLGAHGRTGVGFYAEGGVRQYREYQALTWTVGLSVRVPAAGVLAWVIPIPGC